MWLKSKSAGKKIFFDGINNVSLTTLEICWKCTVAKILLKKLWMIFDINSTIEICLEIDVYERCAVCMEIYFLVYYATRRWGNSL